MADILFFLPVFQWYKSLPSRRGVQTEWLKLELKFNFKASTVVDLNCKIHVSGFTYRECVCEPSSEKKPPKILAPQQPACDVELEQVKRSTVI